MARARNIKPSFFKNELLGQCDPLIGLLFISLWTLADKAGRLEDRPLRIKAETFPYREGIDINGYLTELVALKFIERYKVGEIEIIEIVNFIKHQTPHSTEKHSELPSKPIDTPITLINESAAVNGHINVLIPDSPLLIPDSPLLIPDSLSISSANADSSSSCEDFPEPVAQKIKRNGIPYQTIVNLYHEKLPMCPKVELITTKRKGQISARWLSGELNTLEAWGEFFQFCSHSDFLTGKVAPKPQRTSPFIANLEWLTNETNYAKIIEGNYRNGQKI